MRSSQQQGYDIIQSEGLIKTSQGKARKLIFSASAVIALATIICIVVGLTSGPGVSWHSGRFLIHNRLSIPLISDQQIQIVCEHALFSDVCVHQLSSHNFSRGANPLDIVSVATQIAVDHVNDAHGLATRCSSKQGLDLLESQCARDCMELMEDSKTQLNAAISKISSLGALDSTSMRAGLQDVKVWLSSSVSYQTACSDGFDLARGSIQLQIQSNQDLVFKVVANALCLVNLLAETGNNLSSWMGKIPPSPPAPHPRRFLSIKQPVDIHRSAYVRKDPFPPIVTTANDSAFPDWIPLADRQLLQAPTSSVVADAVVAQDGSGDFETISDALNNLPQSYVGRYVIYIREGEYEEVFNVTSVMTNITFLGDGIGYTVITGSRNVASGLYTTYRSSTVGISGSGFLARDITFRNTAGPSGYQAVAVRAGADLLVFDKCSFEGYQDTLYALSSRQFYRDCKISGTVDFIFGNAIAIFQNCDLIARQPINGQQNTYTAQGRKLSADISGYSFQNCTLTGDESLLNSTYNVSTYLGRPWKAYSRVVFMESDMKALVDPQGWLPWNASNPFTDTVYYGEYQNRGTGSSTAQRVDWAGVHPNMTQQEALQFTVENFISGDEWLSALEVAYQAGLSE